MRFLLFTIAVVLGLTVAAQPKPHVLAYTFRYDTTAPALLVTVRFKGDSSGRTGLMLPERWASQNSFWRAVTALEAVTPGVRIEAGADSFHRVLRHRPGAEITLRYQVRQDWEGPFSYPMNYRAVVQRSWMHATGYSLLVKPDWPQEERLRLTVDFRVMPKGWTVANSFSATSRIYTGECRVAEAENAFFGAGDYRLHRRTVAGGDVFVVVRGTGWAFSDSALVYKVVNTIGKERQFWNDSSQKYFLVSLEPFEGGKSFNLNGTALHQAFFLGMTRDSFAASSMQSLLAHEYLHRWIGGTLQLQGKEEEQYWFSEGFTEYYSHKVPEWAGIIDMPEFLSLVNKTLRDYYLSPVRNASLKAAGDSFWLDRHFQRLPYVKGYAFALYFDSEIQRLHPGRSLDEVLFALNAAHADGKPFVVEELIAGLGALVPGADSLYRSWVLHGNNIPVQPLPAAAAYALRNEQLGVFALGFSEAGLKKGQPIQGVVPGSAAWEAGLRDGQILQSMSIYFGDVTKPVSISVLDNGEVKKLSYYPIDHRRIAVPQYDLGAR